MTVQHQQHRPPGVKPARCPISVAVLLAALLFAMVVLHHRPSSARQVREIAKVGVLVPGTSDLRDSSS